MNSVDQATATQLKNIQTRTGKTLEELYALIRASGLVKHGEIRDLLKDSLKLGHGDANTLAHAFRKAAEASASADSAGSTASADDVLDGIYAGAKAELRPIHTTVMKAIQKLGDFEIAPKKGYVSLRRKKQFAMVGPASKMRVEVGLNMKGVPGTDRLVAQPAGGMCQYKVYLSAPTEVDAELIGWLKQAYESAG